MSLEEQNWKESVASRAPAAMKAETERDHLARLVAALESWRPYILRRQPMRKAEWREVIQDQVCQQILLETVGVEAKEAA